MYTLGKEINFEIRNIFLAWLILDAHLGRGNQLKRNWLKNTKNCLAWLISDVQLVKRNQLCNENYFSGLINHRCALGEKKLYIMRNIILAWLITDVHCGRRNQLKNEKYFSCLINLRCALEEKKWKAVQLAPRF